MCYFVWLKMGMHWTFIRSMDSQTLPGGNEALDPWSSIYVPETLWRGVRVQRSDLRGERKLQTSSLPTQF